MAPDERARDGPFAEYTGYYGEPKEVGVIRVSAITPRADAIYHDLDPAHREHNLAGVLPFESHVFRKVYEAVPSVTDVYMPPSGCCFFSAYIAVCKRAEGEGKMAGLAALSANPNLKHVVVVDDDIDVSNEEAVWWAVNTRLEADRDLAIIPHALGAHLDPSAYGEDRLQRGAMTTKLILDATRPLSRPFAERIRPDPDLWERLRLDTYLE